MEVSCLESLISTCSALKKLSLENCEINDEICHLLAERNSKTLDTLNLAMVSFILAVEFIQFAKR